MATTIAEGETSGGAGGDGALGAEQRARVEANRRRARELRAARARAASGPPPAPAPAPAAGGFLPEAAASGAARVAAPPDAPEADPRSRVPCVECGRPFATSYLYETFGHAACDACRDDGGEHALIPRTEARRAYLLQECDLDARPPPLRSVRRRNPHARHGDMRLYLRCQVEARALQVWGSARALEEEAARREAARAAGAARRGARRLRALRLEARSALVARAPRSFHTHQFGPETHDAAADTYSRACTLCDHVDTYEKM